MPIEIINDGTTINAYLSGDLDHHNAFVLRSELDSALQNFTPELLILDFSGITFMDSSGIGFILGRKKILDSFGARLAIKNVSPYVEKIIKLSGLSYLCLESNTKKVKGEHYGF